MIYGYGYHYIPPEVNGHDSVGLHDGYFAIPPRRRATDTLGHPIDDDDVPPPYVASQVELLAMVQRVTEDASTLPLSRSQRGSEDGDNDEGIVSFSTNSRRETPRIPRNASCDGPHQSTEAEEEAEVVERPSITFAEIREEEPARHRRSRLLILVYFLQPLRLLAALPGCIGTFWLLRNAVQLLWQEGAIWQRDGKPGALEFGLASLWSITTAYHALSFTTLLLRRWLHYYSVLPSFIRLIALQAICWPLVRLTLYILGPKNPLAGWIIISSTTAFSDTVARWVVSNITHEDSSSTAAFVSGTVYRNRKKKRKRNSMAFWKAVMGGPSDSSNGITTSANPRATPLSSSNNHNGHNDGTLRNRHLMTESEAESDVDSLGRSRPRPAPWDDYLSEVTSGGEESVGKAVRRQRVTRIFHWDVAIRRNVIPIAFLTYLSLWSLLLEQVRQRV
ncbi:hypothetical protein CBS101457_002547 [Exobasidium rhododendri]|nr:hypothetical protein CBS101457_002547 [Exobasidium rhododendri]